MSFVNTPGDYCHGKGGGHAGINNDSFSLGGVMGWMDDETVAFASGEIICYGTEWTACQYHRPTRMIVPLSDPLTGANHGFAGGGHAAWWWGPNDHQPPEVKALGGLWSTTGFRAPRAGLLGMGPDGSIAYKPNYDSGGPTMVRELDGSEWLLTPNHAYALQLIGQRRALFNDSVNGFTVVGMSAPKVLGACYFPFAIGPIDGVWYFCCQYPDYGTVIHPFNNPKRGYRIRAKDVEVWPGWGFNGNFIVPCAPNDGEQPGDMICEQISLHVPMIDLVTPSPKLPVIQGTLYDDVLESGKGWQTSFREQTSETTVRVWLDTEDDLHISATNPAGLAQTGLQRHVTIKGAPMPVRNDRVWFSPANASADYQQLLDQLPPNAGAFGLLMQNVILTAPEQGPNTKDAMLGWHAYQKLADARFPVILEMGGVKAGDCDAEKAKHILFESLTVIVGDGGALAGLVQDEPLTNGCPEQSLEATADYTVDFMNYAWSLGLKQVGIAEAFPNISFEIQKRYLELLVARGAPPTFFHSDIFWDHVSDGTAKAYILSCMNLCKKYNIAYGVYCNSTKDPIATDQQHYDNVLTLAQRIKRLVPEVPRVVLAAWAFRGTPGGHQDVPNNLGAAGLLALHAELQKLFPPLTVTPLPPREDEMFVNLVDPLKKDAQGNPCGTLAVKEVHPSKETGKSLLILADFKGVDQWGNDTADPTVRTNKVCSIQSGGKVGWRDSGTDGAWEQCLVDGSRATYRQDEKYYTFFFQKVKGL